MSREANWYESFFNELYGAVLAGQFTPEESQQTARLIGRLGKLRRGQRVLDLPCGQGRLTLPLARLGLNMTGVDLSDAYIRRARRAARAEKLEVRFAAGDMRRIEFPGEFHAVFNWFGSFGYFSDRDNLLVARRAHDALRPGGRFLVEGLNKSWLLANRKNVIEMKVGDVEVHNRVRWDGRTSRCYGVWKLTRGKQSHTRRSRIRVYSGGEIRALLHEAGFREIELHGKPPAGRLTRYSPRWIAVGRRTDTAML